MDVLGSIEITNITHNLRTVPQLYHKSTTRKVKTMVMIDIHNLSSVLSKKGVKICTGSEGQKCFRPRRSSGRLCLECHRGAMRKLREKSVKRIGSFEDYDFNQENGI